MARQLRSRGGENHPEQRAHLPSRLRRHFRPIRSVCGLAFWGWLGREVCGALGVETRPTVPRPTQIGREKPSGYIKKVLPEFFFWWICPILGPPQVGQGGCSCRGSPEIQAQVEGGLLLPMSPSSMWTRRPQVLCEGTECHPEGCSVCPEALCEHKPPIFPPTDLDSFCLYGDSSDPPQPGKSYEDSIYENSIS